MNMGDMLDYALLKSNYDCNNNSCRLLAGERWLLYESYQNCLKSGNTGFSDFDKNIFYRYLVLRTFFRSEMIQVNKWWALVILINISCERNILLREKGLMRMTGTFGGKRIV